MILVHNADTLLPFFINEKKIVSVRKDKDITIIDTNGDIPYGVSETPEEVVGKIHNEEKADG